MDIHIHMYHHVPPYGDIGTSMDLIIFLSGHSFCPKDRPVGKSIWPGQLHTCDPQRIEARYQRLNGHATRETLALDVRCNRWVIHGYSVLLLVILKLGDPQVTIDFNTKS